ncbi:hypothetical protein [Paraburkholderia humisilvae]|uniref:Uncharacterized protein n=1 Tax=Paraburkholderia humisilvae TaxID=627669 RepID=A0A6J5F3A2_9BURK|nr:hypothetical protein [Paraburkholderia humisilvae]CAB3772052.1 hypothetical protein LMG29542_06781 [Paraburkholderia humisilvae]
MRNNIFTTLLGRASAALRSRAVVVRRIAAGLVMSMPVHAAYAGGGLNAGTQAVYSFTMWFYGLCGVLAGAYLLWVGVQCWSNKADWIHDFGGGIAKVAGVGSALVLAGWAFGLFA